MIVNIFYNICAFLVIKEILRENFDILSLNLNEVDYKNFLVTLTYKCIYYYSKFQIFLIEAKQYSYPFIKNILRLPEPSVTSIQPFIELYNDGTLVIKENWKQHEDILESLDYNYIIYCEPMQENKNILNKVICKEIPIVVNYELCNIKFISLNIEYNNSIYEIHLNTSEYNYYIVNNAIDKLFVYYYFKNIIKTGIEDSLDTFAYKLTLMDHNVNIVQLNEKYSIIMQKDNYIIQHCLEKEKEIVENDE